MQCIFSFQFFFIENYKTVYNFSFTILPCATFLIDTANNKMMHMKKSVLILAILVLTTVIFGAMQYAYCCSEGETSNTLDSLSTLDPTNSFLESPPITHSGPGCGGGQGPGNPT